MTDRAPAPLDLSAVAAAHAVRHVTLDLASIDVREVLSVGDVVDMAGALGVAPETMALQLAPGGKIAGTVALDVGLALAWVIGRKAEPDLTYELVRSTWQLELVGVGTRAPGPTPAATQRSSARRTSSPSRKQRV
jgi:hypothetical protein